MEPINPLELVALGTKIAEVGGKLMDLRAKRDVLNAQVSELEKELTPLLVRHSALVAAIAGTAMPAPVVVLPVQSASPNATPANSKEALERRVLNFLKDAEPGVGPLEIAEALKENPARVREVMADLRNKAMRERQEGSAG